MVKGTPSAGKHNTKKTHMHCRRCGRHSYHLRHKCCSACGFGRSKRIRRYTWQNKKLNKVRLV